MSLPIAAEYSASRSASGAPLSFRILNAQSILGPSTDVYDLLRPFATFGVQVTSAGTVTIDIEGSLNGLDWAQVHQVSATGPALTSFSCPPITYVRANVTVNGALVPITLWLSALESNLEVGDVTVDATFDEPVAVTLDVPAEVRNPPGEPLEITGNIVVYSDDLDPVTVDGIIELGPDTLAALTPAEVIATSSDAEHVEDTPHVSGDTGSFLLGVRNDLLADLTNTDGDYSPIAVTREGKVRVVLTDTILADLELGHTVSGARNQGNDQPAVLAIKNPSGATLTTSGGGSIDDLEYCWFSVDASGRVGIADLGGSITVDAVSLPLPTGAATQTTLAATLAALGPLATEATLASLAADVANGVTINQPVAVTDNSGSLTVDATNLDIRDLTAADVVTAEQGTVPWVVSGTVAATLSEPISVDDNGGSLTVDASNLDIRDLTFAADKVDASGSTVALDAPTLAALETISVANFPATQPVSGTVALDAPSLAALETINAVQSGAWAVTVSDGSGPVTVDGTVAATQSGSWSVEIANDSGNSIPVAETTGLVPKVYDFIDLAYTGDDVTTVVYKAGGSGGTTVATLALVYSSPGVLDTVTRT